MGSISKYFHALWDSRWSVLIMLEADLPLLFTTYGTSNNSTLSFSSNSDWAIISSFACFRSNIVIVVRAWRRIFVELHGNRDHSEHQYKAFDMLDL